MSDEQKPYGPSALEFILLRNANLSMKEIAKRWNLKDRGDVYDLYAKWKIDGSVALAEAQIKKEQE